MRRVGAATPLVAAVIVFADSAPPTPGIRPCSACGTRSWAGAPYIFTPSHYSMVLASTDRADIA